MILIFSKSFDYTTFQVIKWLNHLGEFDIVRINSDEKNNITFSVRENDFTIQIDEHIIESDKIRAVWYRKGANWLGGQFNEISLREHPKLTLYLNDKMRKENQKLSEYLHYLIEKKYPVLGSAFKSNLNKLVTLNIAKSVGLRTPEFFVVNEKKSIECLIKNGNSYITKAMSDGVYLFESDEKRKGYFSYTELLARENIARYTEKMPPSFIQSKIEKHYEVRVFFLDGQFFAWAIFSQADDQTRTDYRKYNYKKPNRVVPYLLPEKIINKLSNLFKKIGLNTGSADLMVDLEDNHYFLEINPVGQFNMLSKLANNQLELKVAKWLINNANRQSRLNAANSN